MPWHRRASLPELFTQPPWRKSACRRKSRSSLEEELERERRDHALIDEEKLGMDELEEEHLKRERQPGAQAGR